MQPRARASEILLASRKSRSSCQVHDPPHHDRRARLDRSRQRPCQSPLQLSRPRAASAATWPVIQTGRSCSCVASAAFLLATDVSHPRGLARKFSCTGSAGHTAYSQPQGGTRRRGQRWTERRRRRTVPSVGSAGPRSACRATIFSQATSMLAQSRRVCADWPCRLTPVPCKLSPCRVQRRA